MKEYWGVRHGGNRVSVDNQHLKTRQDIANRQNGGSVSDIAEVIGDRKSDSHNAQLKTTEDIAESIGESIHQTRRILKLHDLIPELQDLVSEGKLGTTAGEQLAHMTEENQRALLDV